VTDLILNFGVNAFTGWGIVGYNYCGLLSHEYNVITPNAFGPNEVVGMDPLKWPTLDKIIRNSREWKYHPDCIWMDPIGNDLKTPHQEIDAKVQIGRVIVEKPDIAHAFDNLKHFDRLLTGSNWNKNILEAATGKEVKVIHEGIDPNLFHPGGKSGWLDPDRFHIFSSGKVEFRKAQDAVLLAFRRFSRKHDNARLVVCWNSPFSDIGNGFRGLADAPLWLNEKGQLDVHRWARDNDVDPSKVINFGCVPNFVLPQILHEMDVMLAPTRVESCTSLPVKEAMACGVPVIYGYHTGMEDLDGFGIPLRKQTPIRASSEYFFPSNNIDWYESDQDEIDEALEMAYKSSTWQLDEDAAEFIRTERTWQRHTNELKEWLK
jgi:glycosyltransferase involved in cell wall biosynthesis